ncbi:PEP-CTERM sorting domain-containing protein [Argonema galeatum]|uniref:PEP-CTERM sorting domain-containing protein n=1 Tax=Argonema galeatum TaxID=2942762 RepID=UPI002010EFD8|nr:PEP-CTERM sorting domain-containing protein [Argonema galeatum]MCL1465540.1 PEP-CTERM sorting domain-containing protein [Argonema galeatum A003/A1]
MLKFSKSLSKSIVGLTTSVILIPVMSSSASAASLKKIEAVFGLAEQNTSSTQAKCTPSLQPWTMILSCTQSYTASTRLGVSTAGRVDWRNIYQKFEFKGDRGARYRAKFSLTGDVFASVKAAGFAGANAASGLAPRSGGPETRLNLASAIASTSSDWDRHSSSSYFDFNGGSTWTFRVGAQTQGVAWTYGLGFAEAKSSINFTSIATITKIGSSRSSLFSSSSVGSASNYGFNNASDDGFSSVSDDDFIPVSDDEFSNIYDDDFSTISDDGFSNVYDYDFSTISDDGIYTSVPEPSQIGGLAALLTMLLATKRSRFAKKHTKETEKLVGKTAVKV